MSLVYDNLRNAAQAACCPCDLLLAVREGATEELIIEVREALSAALEENHG